MSEKFKDTDVKMSEKFKDTDVILRNLIAMVVEFKEITCDRCKKIGHIGDKFYRDVRHSVDYDGHVIESKSSGEVRSVQLCEECYKQLFEKIEVRECYYSSVIGKCKRGIKVGSNKDYVELCDLCLLGQILDTLKEMSQERK